MSTLSLDKPSARRISARLSTRAGRTLSSVEALLFAFPVAIFFANSLTSPNFLSSWNLAAIMIELVTFGLGLLNAPGIGISIFIGLLLILVIALPVGIRRIRSKGAA
jgi:ribose/xylose/arabinose/galactoside ABC-type transport system permease subunit